MWTIDDEVNFFNDASRLASIEQLMVNINDRYYAFSPKTEDVKVNTPQARNAFVGRTTETWCKELFDSIAKSRIKDILLDMKFQRNINPSQMIGFLW